MQLEQKVVAVTGAGRGLGAAMAEEFAASGAHVFVADVDEPSARETVGRIEERGHKAVAGRADISDAGQVDAMIAAVDGAFGRLDVMVNNAGRAGQVPFLDMTADEWDRVLDTNLRGTFLCCRAAAKQMISQGGGGRIINVTSALGVKGARSSAHYAASKGGVNALTRSLAYELAPHGIDVIAAGPGQTDTPMWRSMYPEEEQQNRIQAGQVQRPEEFARLMVFLASDDARGLSGQVIAKGVYVPT